MANSESGGHRTLLEIPESSVSGLWLTPKTDVTMQVDDEVRVRFHKPRHKRDCCYTVWLYYEDERFRSLSRDFEDWHKQISLALRDPDQFMLENEAR